MNIDCQNYDIISFDIFDTLIKRKYHQPKDLFKHLEVIFGDKSFAKKRIKAEHLARKKSKEQEITLDEIYALLPKKYQSYKEEEKALEINNSFANPEIKEFYNTARKLNKKVIATSDMYLDGKTIESILKKAGYDYFDKIYISSIYRKTKCAAGDLFDIVLKDFKINPAKVLHIGDNYKSDFEMPKQKGLDAYYYQEQTLPKDKKFNNFNLKKRDLEKSCLYALCDNYYKIADNYWQRLGFTYGGPLCYTFSLWLKENFERANFGDILFISRDGWILKKVFDLIYPENNYKTHYIYASRQICKNAASKEYKKYLAKQNMSKGPVALVDTFTNKWTSPEFLQQFFSEEITCFYWRFRKCMPKWPSFAFEDGTAKIKFWDFMEFVMTAPELPGIDIKKGQVVFGPSNSFEETRIERFEYLSSGILDFVKQYQNLYQNQYLKIDKIFSINWLNHFFNNLNQQDIKYLSTLYHTTFHDTQEYLPLVPPSLLSWQKFNLPPFLYVDISQFGIIKLKLFNKITLFKQIIKKDKSVCYFLRIPVCFKKRKTI